MFAHDFYHSQINILGMLSTYIEKTERSDTTNLQSSIVNIQFRLVRVRDFRAANQGLSPYPDRGVCRIDPALR